MRLAIHHFKGSFSERWITYCEANNIDFKKVDCFRSDIMDQLTDCEALMWHWSQEDPKTRLFARQLTYAIDAAGKRVFPDSHTVWHFDDKVGQKYLLEALELPMVPSHVFYSKSDALEWSQRTQFPKVFKLRGGAGSINVKLVKSKSQATKLIRKAFNKGFGVSGRRALFRNRIWHFKKDKNLTTFLGLFKGVARLFLASDLEKAAGKEKGYAYFQDFIPNNKSDIRIVIIGQSKAFAIERMVRKGDFRASGSGIIHYLDDHTIDKEALKVSFEAARKIKSQSIALDFVYDQKAPLIVEVSYGFAISAYDACKGYWDDKMNWYPGPFNPQNFMLEHLIETISQAN